MKKTLKKIQMDWFCNKCTLQFDKKYVFDLHRSLVHGEKMAEVKIEPQISEENFQECQAGEPVFPDHVVETEFKCNTCNSLLKTKVKYSVISCSILLA